MATDRAKAAMSDLILCNINPLFREEKEDCWLRIQHGKLATLYDLL